MPRTADQFPGTAGTIAEAAAQWVVRRDRGLTRDEAAALEQWRQANPRHAAEFDRIGAGWQSLNGLGAVPALAAEAEAVVQRARSRRARRRLVVLASGWCAAAAAIAMAYVGWWRTTPVAPADNFQVLASTSREVRLPDGSIALLNGDSRIETAFTPAERRIRLVQGEALFTVAKNPNRPFFVTAGPVTVRAVGTAFNVWLASTSVEVLVTEGKVRVDDNVKGTSLLPDATNHIGDWPHTSDHDRVLTAGQKFIVDLAPVIDPAAQVRVSTVAPYEVEQALAWQNTRLMFNDTPLNEVVAAFNRYNNRKLVLGDDSLRSRKISGVVRADNLDGFIRLLETGVDVRAESRGDRETVLRPGR